MKKINKKQNYEVFIDSIFERAQDPIAELKKIFTIHPIFFLNDKVVEYIDSKLDKFNLVLNTACIGEFKHVVFSCGLGSGGGWCSYGHTSSEPSYGPCHTGGGGWCSYGHTSSEPSYGPCHSGGGGFCSSTINTKCNNLILVKKDKKISYGIIN